MNVLAIVVGLIITIIGVAACTVPDPDYGIHKNVGPSLIVAGLVFVVWGAS